MSANMSFNFHIPTRIVFRWGALQELGALPELQGRRCMLFSWPGFNAGQAVALLGSHVESVDVVDEFEENPSVEMCRAIAERARERKIEAVIGIGGGSTMDTAKAVTFFAANPEWDKSSSVEPAPADMVIVAVPTTSGTGSEVSPFTVLTESETHVKTWIKHQSILPQVALCDPELTATMPRGVTANTGVDALSHATEAYLSKLCAGVLEPIALDACRRVKEDLPKVLESPADHALRESLMLASLEGGFVLSACGTVFVHALGYRLTQAFGYTHGFVNGLMLGAFVERLAERGSDRAKRLLDLFDGDMTGFIRSVGIGPDRAVSVVDDATLDDWTESGWIAYGRKNAVVEVERDDVRFVLESAFA